MKRITIQDNEDFLRQISTSVDFKNDLELEANIAILNDFCENNDILAMAAIQLGIPKRIVYLKNTNLDIVNKMQVNIATEDELLYNEARVLINPTILKKEGLTEYWEACASCLDNCGLVFRPYKLEVEYFDINGVKYIEEFKGFEATVLSHEIDHLDGILHIDIAKEVKVMPKEERKAWRVTHGYKIYEEEGDYENLKANQENN